MKKSLLICLTFLISLFIWSQNDYTYDAVGNLKSDANKGITNIEYALCLSNGNIGQSFYLPKKIEFESGDYITFLYDAYGNKLEKEVYKQGKLIKHVQYQGDYTYVNGELKYKNHNEGFIKYDIDENGNQTTTYVYHFLDHQNNVRLLYADLNGDGKVDQSEVLAEYNYYPFGLKHKGYNNVEHPILADSNYNKGYQQQEFEDDLGLGWYSFKYRNYDPAIARFTTEDPLAEEYAYNSPYAFQENKLGMGVELEGLEMVPNMSAQHDIYQQLKTSSSSEQAQARIDQMNRATGVMAGTALDFAPIAGDVKGVTEGIIGQDLATGGVLSPFERGMSLLGLSELRGASKVGKAIDLVQAGNSMTRKFWTSETVFEGVKVYQRNDIIDPSIVSVWKQGGKEIKGSNIERMRSGRAPIGNDGKPVNLHHMLQDETSGLAEMTESFHKQNHSTIHINPNTTPSGINRNSFGTYKKSYWKERAKDFE